MQQDILNYVGVPSAHNPEKEYHPKFENEQWICDCEHFKNYHTDCRHILIKQLQLKNEYKGGVRDTSIEAYLEVMADPQSLNETYQEILKALLKIGHPVTDREIARFLLFADPNKVRPRRNELADPTKIFPTFVHEVGKRVCEVSGKMSYVWELTEHGRKLAMEFR